MVSVDSRYDWLDELPLAPGEPFLRMATRGIDASEWLLTDTETRSELQLRQELLRMHPDFVQIEHGYDDALDELISAVEAHRDAPLTAGPVVEGVRPELAALAVSIQEDVQLLVRTDQHWRLIGGVLLFPDQWRLPDKIGLSIARVHGPTDGYDELLEAKVDRFFDRLAVDRYVVRRNWFVHDEPIHFLDQHATRRPIDVPEDCGSLWIRSERQTLRRLPLTDAIVFTIKTQFAPFLQLRARPEIAEGVATYFDEAGDRLLENKDVAGRTDAVTSYLRYG